MKISRSVKPYQMAAHMGPDASVIEGRDMIALCRFLGFDDTSTIPENVWQEMLKNVCGTGLSEDELSTIYNKKD